MTEPHAPRRGFLTERGEGEPLRGVAELLRGADRVTSAGALGGYTAPQTSHADVIGSVGARDELSADDVRRVRAVLDRHYRLTVTDTGNNHQAGCYRAAVATADAVVVPVTPNPSSVEGALRTITRIGDLTDGGTDLRARVTVVITHDGGLEDVSLLADLPRSSDTRTGPPIRRGPLPRTSGRAVTNRRSRGRHEGGHGR